MIPAAALMLFSSAALHAKAKCDHVVKITDTEVLRTGDQLKFDFTADYNRLVLKKQESLKLTPMIIQQGDTTDLAPIYFVGKVRHRMDERNHKLYGYEPGYVKPYKEVVYKGKLRRAIKKQIKNGTYSSIYTIPYLSNSPVRPAGSIDVAARQEFSCCGESKLVAYDALASIRQVAPRISLIAPTYQGEKLSSEQMTAHIGFPVSKTAIQRSFGNNNAELNRVDQFTLNIVNDWQLEIRNIYIKGYASPEGSYKLNTRLAEERVTAFKQYLISDLRMDASKMNVDFVPEDWDGVRKWVAASNLKFKNEVIRIIDETPDPDARDQKIRNLDRGVTYQTLLKEVYPDLRRVDYLIEYEITPFTVEKGREVVLTHPERLSLEEFHAVALSYPAGSPEYIDTYRTAVKLYPNDPVACNNMAALAIQAGNFSEARSYLDRVADDPMSQNNLGVLNALEGNYSQAEANFRRAIENGDQDAAYNLEHMYDLKLK